MEFNQLFSFSFFLLDFVEAMACTFAKYGPPCGMNPRIKAETATIPLVKCQKDVTSHVAYYKIAGTHTEIDLILARTGNFSVDPCELTICPLHRDLFGIGWKRSSSLCCVPAGIATHKRPSKPDRGVGKVLSERIFKETQTLVPVGAGKRDHWGCQKVS